ncbi:MAG: glycoside hydrolase [Mariniblastus sp.]|nr:glycoside hydrolase [Mariniblastus sp.]
MNRLNFVYLLIFLFAIVHPCRGQDSPIRQLDLDDWQQHQVVVDREAGQYLGHPTTCLLDDGKTILCVYPKGHGRGGIVYKRSTDGGRSWSERLKTPDSWATSQEVPTLHRVTDAGGKKRIIMFSGLYPTRMAVSTDEGLTWGELEPVGNWGGIVVMGSVVELKTGPGHYLGLFHDDGRFIAAQNNRQQPVRFTLYKTLSTDGGLSWSTPVAIDASTRKHICEPGTIRSPDGKQLAVLLRENSRRENSQIIFSEDEGRTWSKPRDLPDSLNGDRHTAQYTPDGRLFISYRCRWPQGKSSDYEGDWVGWVGTYQDLVDGASGEYFIRIKDNMKGADCAYPGVEILPDGSLVTTTYGHWTEGESPYILSVRFRLEDLDQAAAQEKE